MAWIVLVVAGAFEVLWASLLDRTNGFTRLWPSVGFLVALSVSMYLLSVAVRSIPIGTAYAVWVGIGASLTVVYAMVTGTEPVSLAKVLLIVGLIGCVVGLKVVH